MGPDAIAFYVSGQLLTEDYYAWNKLVKGFLGTNNLDSNSRLCMSSAVAGYKGAFGSRRPATRLRRPRPGRLLPAARHEHRGLSSDRLVAHPRPPGGGRVRHLRRPAADRDRPRVRPAPAGPPRYRPGSAERDAARDRARRSDRPRARPPPHHRDRGRAGRGARMVAGARRGHVRRTGGRHRAGGAALRGPGALHGPVVDGGKPVDGRHAQEPCADQPVPRHRTDRQARHRPPVPHRPAQRDGRTRDRRSLHAAARLPRGGLRSRSRGDGGSLGARARRHLRARRPAGSRAVRRAGRRAP